MLLSILTIFVCSAIWLDTTHAFTTHAGHGHGSTSINRHLYQKQLSLESGIKSNEGLSDTPMNMNMNMKWNKKLMVSALTLLTVGQFSFSFPQDTKAFQFDALPQVMQSIPSVVLADSNTNTVGDSSSTTPTASTSTSTSTSTNTKKSVKLPSGLQYYDAIVGNGPEVAEGKSVKFVWVLRRSNGYFVDSNADFEPFIYRVGNTKKVMQGIDEGIRGMREGGVRRMNIPPGLGFVDGVGDDKPGPIPSGFGPKRQILTRRDREVWYFEIKMLKVKEFKE